MDKSGAGAYVYAKASGMLAKSFVGDRALQLFEAKSISELWTLVFKTEVPMMPEVLLAKRLEVEAERKFLSDFTMLLGCYSNPEPVSLALLQSYEYSNLKDIVHALIENRKQIPDLADLKTFSFLHYERWPNLAEITADTPLSWYDRIPSRNEQKDIDHRLDAQYMISLWNSVKKIPAGERKPVEKLIKDELIMQNCLWALRLKVYYGMSKEEILNLLVPLSDFSESNPENDILAGEAVKLLDLEIDNHEHWENWKYSAYLNPYVPEEIWSVDPRYVQQKAKIAQTKAALKLFHQHPFTDCVLVTWFKIKQYELDCIRTAAEGLCLSVDQSDIKNFLGMEE